MILVMCSEWWKCFLISFKKKKIWFLIFWKILVIFLDFTMIRQTRHKLGLAAVYPTPPLSSYFLFFWLCCGCWSWVHCFAPAYTSGRQPVNPWPQSQLIGRFGEHLVAFLQYGVAVCPCVLQAGSYDGHERESLWNSPRTQTWIFLVQFSGSDVSWTEVHDLITSVTGRCRVNDQTVRPLKT